MRRSRLRASSRAGEIHLFLAAVFKIENPAVLQELIDDADHLDVVAHILDPGRQAADPRTFN